MSTSVQLVTHLDSETGTGVSAQVYSVRSRYTFTQEVPIADESSNLMYNNENPEHFPDGGWEATLVLIGSFFGLIAVFGVLNIMGAIQSYVSTHQLADVGSEVTSWVFSAFLGISCLGTVFAGEIFDRFGSRIPLIVGTIFFTLGLFLTAQCVQVYQFVLCFGLLTGIGTSLCMAPLIGVLSHWYLKRRATACSIATSGGLVGSSLFAIMLQRLYSSVGYAWAIRALAFICLGCLIVSIVLVKERMDAQSEAVAAPVSDHKNDTIMGSIKDILVSAIDLSVIKDRRFIFVTLGVFFIEITSMCTLTYLSSYALAHGAKERDSYLLITIVNVCGIPSRFLSGVLADKYGRINVMLGASITVTICVFAVWLPAGGNIKILYAFGILFGVTTSAIMSLTPACIGQITKVERFGKVYGTLYFFMTFLYILGMYISSVVIGNGSLERYRYFVVYEGMTAVLGVGFWVLARYSCVGWKICKF